MKFHFLHEYNFRNSFQFFYQLLNFVDTFYSIYSRITFSIFNFFYFSCFFFFTFHNIFLLFSLCQPFPSNDNRFNHHYGRMSTTAVVWVSANQQCQSLSFCNLHPSQYNSGWHKEVYPPWAGKRKLWYRHLGNRWKERMSTRKAKEEKWSRKEVKEGGRKEGSKEGRKEGSQVSK